MNEYTCISEYQDCHIFPCAEFERRYRYTTCVCVYLMLNQRIDLTVLMCIYVDGMFLCAKFSNIHYVNVCYGSRFKTSEDTVMKLRNGDIRLHLYRVCCLFTMQCTTNLIHNVNDCINRPIYKVTICRVCLHLPYILYIHYSALPHNNSQLNKIWNESYCSLHVCITLKMNS